MLGRRRNCLRRTTGVRGVTVTGTDYFAHPNFFWYTPNKNAIFIKTVVFNRDDFTNCDDNNSPKPIRFRYAAGSDSSSDTPRRTKEMGFVANEPVDLSTNEPGGWSMNEFCESKAWRGGALKTSS